MKSSSAVLAVAVLTLGLSALAIPAQAAAPALPGTDHLFNASCDGNPITLFELDSATGVGTEVGSSDPEFTCGYGAAWDVTSQTLFGISRDGSDSDLVTFDLGTGAATYIGTMVDETDTLVFADSMVIDLEGNAYIVSDNRLYSLALDTAEVTFLGVLSAVDDYSYGFAVDPSTGILYLLQEDGVLLTVDPLEVTATYVATWTFTPGSNRTYGLAIDNAGTAWVVEYPGDENYTALWSTPLASFGVAPELSGDIVDAATESDYEGWWVALVWSEPAPAPAPEPVLAATGFDAAPLALGGLLLAAAGAVLVARRSRRTA